jgi:hypothetical protein
MIRIADAQSVCARRMAAVAVAILMTVNGLAAGGPVSKFTNDGAYASVSGTDGCLYVYVYVSRGGAKSAPQTFLYYQLYDMCSNWQELANGSGTIPNSAFTVKPKGAVLSVTPKASPTFFTRGATGAVSLIFTSNGAYEETFTGHGSLSYADNTIRWHGSSSYRTASVSGTLMGWTFSQLSGQVGEGRQREISFEHSAQ